MPIYSLQAPDGKIYDIEAPEGVSESQLSATLYALKPEAANPPVKTSAGFNVGDIARSAGSGVAGGLQALAGVAGANNPVSEYLGDISKSLQEGLSPERKAEIKARQEKIAAAEKTGNIWEQIKAGAGAVGEAPLQSVASAAGSMVTPIAAGAAAVALAPEALVGYLGANILGIATQATVGAAMGSGQSKQDIYDRVKKEYMDAKVPEAEASKKAMLAQNWVGKNLDQIIINAGTGALEAATGVGRVLAPGKAAKAVTKAPSLLKTVGTVGLEEAAPEALQSVSGTAATNVAATREGFEAPTFQGAAAPAAESALTAFLAGAATGPKEYLNKRGEFEARQKPEVEAAPPEVVPPDTSSSDYAKNIAAQYQEAEARKNELLAQLREIQKNSTTETADRLHNAAIEERVKAMTPELEQLATEYNKVLPNIPVAEPVEEVAAMKPEQVAAKKLTMTVGDALDDPIGRFSKDELISRSPKIAQYVDSVRKKQGKPEIDSYSIEDIRNAMPNQLPEAEKADLNSLIAAKTGYVGGMKYDPQDVIKVAQQKNIDTTTTGFKYFLQRATGDNDLANMSQPQLHSAFKALAELPKFEETQILPEKTNATIYNPEQYTSAVSALQGLVAKRDAAISQEQAKLKEGQQPKLKPVSVEEAQSLIKKTAKLKSDDDIRTLFQDANRKGDIDLTSEGNVTLQAKGPQAEFNIEEGAAPAEKTGFNVMRGDRRLYFTENEEEANAKAASLGKSSAPAVAQIEKAIAKENANIATGQRALSTMESNGLFNTPQYQQASARQDSVVANAAQNIKRLNEQKDMLQQPVVVNPTGKVGNKKVFTVKELGVSQKSFDTREEAEKHVLENLPAKRLNELAAQTKAPGFANRLKKEQERRKNPPKPFLAEKPEVKKEPEVKQEPKVSAKAEELKGELLPMLRKFGLGDVALKIEEGMKDEGSYVASTIKVALDANNPIRVLRHESIHGLKDLGFFTPGQWKVLENQADKVWIDKYLKRRNIDGQPLESGQQSRFEAYQNLYNNDMDAIREEAIADAFADFDVNGAPKGVFATLLEAMRKFFRGLRSALTGSGYETSDDVFGKVERGELKAAKAAKAEEAKPSLRTAEEGVPFSTRAIMEQNTTFAQNELGLETVKKKGAANTNNVREVATALNNKTLQEHGRMDEKNHSPEDVQRIADAIADEVSYQLTTKSKTGTGTGWYSHNYPNAVKRLANRFPELAESSYARSVFSSLVAVTSNGERVDKNIDNAIKLYADLREGKPLVAMGNRRPTALEKNLVAIQNLMDNFGEANFENELKREITVKEMNAFLRSQGEKTNTDYLANSRVPAAAIYFGPKLGAFYANLSGSEGYLTMDLWWTRSVNRMRGLLIPRATEASIDKFREMMDIPSATREEVVAASIPLRNKYEEYGYTTELEHLTGSKEPSTNAEKPAWIAKSKRAAGSAYPQLEFEHRLEKMANTIYKNEYDMLEEAPYGAGDRKFMYDAAKKAQSILAKDGIKLTLADIQAALWYYEKRLYAKLTGRAADDIGYEEAIIAKSREGDGRARPSVVFSGQPNGGNDGAGAGEVSNQRGQGNDQAKASLRTNTPEFKKWFGDSKVVDADGNPLVVYHGSLSKNVTEFDTTRIPQRSAKGDIAGTYFTSDPQAAYNYTREFGASVKTPRGDVTQAYLKIENPLNTTAAIKKYRKQGMSFGDAKRKALEVLTPENDGVIFDGDAANPSEYVVFKPTQIKSATGNIGAFDETNPDIRKSLRTQTPEFKKWFGDSKIVDADGNPKVMYHGTARDITAFKPKQAGAIFLTEDPEFAGIFAGDSLEWMAKHADQFLTESQLKKGKALAVTAVRKDYGTKIDGKYIIDNIKANVYKDTAPEGQEYLRNAYKGMLPSGPNIVPVYVRAEKPFDYANPEDISRIQKTESGKDLYEEEIPLIKSGAWSMIEKPQVQKAIKEAGFDSFYVQEGRRKNLAVYEPTQIKSATGNEGTYDISNPDIRKSLRTNVKNDLSTMPNGAAITATMNRVTPKRQEEGFVERLVGSFAPESFSYLRQKALDRYNRLNDYDKMVAKQMGGVELLADQSAHWAALNSDLAAGVTASALGVSDRIGGIPVLKNGYTTVSNENGTVKGAVEIFSPLAQRGDPDIYRLYQLWSAAKRGTRLLKEGRMEFLSPAEVKDALTLSQKYPEFESVQKEWIKFNNGLVKYQIDTGVLSKEAGDEFMKYSDYIPFYRQMDGEATVGPSIYQSISGVKAPKKLTGKGQAPLSDFLETVVRNTQSAIQAGMKNVAAQRAVKNAQTIGMVQRLDYASSAPNVITILENGKKVSYESADKLFIDAVSSLNLPELPFLSILSKPADVLRTMVTLDPGFMLANMMRDSVSAYVTSGAKMTPIASTVKNFGNVIIGKSPEYQKLLSAGVIGGYEFSRNVEASAEALSADLRKKTGTKTGLEKALTPFTGLKGFLERGTEASDAATRIAVYKATLEETGNEAEAIRRALEVMNFNRKGSSAVVRIAAAAIPFLNARIQGLDVFFRAGIRPFLDKNATEQEKQVQKAMLIRGGTIMALSVMYAAAVAGDPDYEKQEAETKDNNWIIPSLGIRVPIPFEVGTLFKTIPERIYRYYYGSDNTKDLADSMSRAIRSTFAINPVPQVIAPMLEVRDNYSAFTQRPIVGEAMKGIAPEYQVGPGTTKMAELLGKEIGMSPIMIDHLYKGYTGTMGMYLADVMDSVYSLGDDNPKASKRFEQTPILKRFLVDPEARGTVSAYYDLKTSVDQVVRTVNRLTKEGNPEVADYVEKNASLYAAKGLMSDMDKQMQELQSYANMIRNAPMGADEKRDALLEITKAQNELTNNIQAIRKAVQP